MVFSHGDLCGFNCTAFRCTIFEISTSVELNIVCGGHSIENGNLKNSTVTYQSRNIVPVAPNHPQPLLWTVFGGTLFFQIPIKMFNSKVWGYSRVTEIGCFWKDMLLLDFLKAVSTTV